MTHLFPFFLNKFSQWKSNEHFQIFSPVACQGAFFCKLQMWGSSLAHENKQNIFPMTRWIEKFAFILVQIEGLLLFSSFSFFLFFLCLSFFLAVFTWTLLPFIAPKKKKKKVEKYKAHCARVTCEPNGEQKFFLYFGSRVAAATCNLWAIWSSGGPLPVRRAGVGFSSALWTWLPRGGESNPASHCTYLQNLISACQPRGGSRGSRGPPPPTLSPYMDAGVGGPGIKVLLTQRVVFRIRKFQNQTVCGKNGWKWGIFCGGGERLSVGPLDPRVQIGTKIAVYIHSNLQQQVPFFAFIHLYIYFSVSSVDGALGKTAVLVVLELRKTNGLLLPLPQMDFFFWIRHSTSLDSKVSSWCVESVAAQSH